MPALSCTRQSGPGNTGEQQCPRTRNSLGGPKALFLHC